MSTKQVFQAIAILIASSVVSTAADYNQINSQGGAAGWNQASWEPGPASAPTAGNNYFSSAASQWMNVRTPENGSPEDFIGLSLSIGNNARLITKHGNNTNAVIQNLHLDGGYLWQGFGNRTHKLSGNLDIASDSTVMLGGGGRRIWFQNGNLSGAGTLSIEGGASFSSSDYFYLRNMVNTGHSGDFDVKNARFIIEDSGNDVIGDTSRVTLDNARFDVRSNETMGGISGNAGSSISRGGAGLGQNLILQPQTDATFAGTFVNNFTTLQISGLTGVSQEITSPTLQVANLVVEGGTLVLDTTTTNVTTSTPAQGLFVGKFGNGRLDHNGGTTTITEDMRIAEKSGSQGTFNMNGGLLTVDNLVAGRNGNATSNINVTGGIINASEGGWATFAGTGTFTQTGGDTNFSFFRITNPGFGTTETGTLELNGGTFTTGSLDYGDGTATFTMNGGTLRAGSNFTVAGPIGLGTNGGTFDSNGNTMTITGDLTGPGPITKSGPGTVELSGNSVSVTDLVVESGTLVLDTTTTDITTSAARQGFFIESGSRVDHNGGTTTVTEDIRIAETGSPAPFPETIVNMNGGTLTTDNLVTARNGGAKTTFNMNDGNLIVSEGGWATFAGEGTFTQTGGTATFNQFSITHPGFGTGEKGALILNGGTFTTSTLEYGDGATKTFTMNGGTLRAGGPSLEVAGPIGLGASGGTFDSNNHTLIVSGDLTGNGPIAKSGPGTVELSGNNALSAVTVNNGTLQIADSAALGSPSSLTVGTGTPGPGAILDLTGLGVFSPGNIVINGSGKILTNGFTIDNGTTLSPGNSPDTLTLDAGTGDIVWGDTGAGGIYDWEVLDRTGGNGTGWDFIQVENGDLDLTGLTGAPGSQAIINVTGLDIPNSGIIIKGQVSSFEILNVTGGIIDGFAAGKFLVSPGNFASYGFFDPVRLSGNSLYLDFTSTIPEPSTWAMLGLLLAAIGHAAYRRRSRTA